jgi:hypothetical protein
MRTSRVVLFCAFFLGASMAHAGELKLPPEVTPAMRAACEHDVRRLCIGASPTIAKVKRCVMAKFMSLGKRCQIELASAGVGAFSR